MFAEPSRKRSLTFLHKQTAITPCGAVAIVQ